jgi:N-acetylglucosaminyl-diphospho-decaprenol L-rhamnosyltransferase
MSTIRPVPTPLSGGPTAQPLPTDHSTGRTAWMESFLEAGPVDVSVCIANWNCRDLLRACLESLHDRPQGVRLETIVVDNASTDGAADMVAREFPEVVLIRNPTNVGFSRANNQAARQARGRYLFFLNNDTFVPEGALRRLLDFAEAHPGAGLIGPRLRDGGGQTQVSYRNKPGLATLLHRTTLFRWTGLLRGAYRRYRRDEFDPESVRTVDVLMGAAMFLPQQAFFDAGCWDEDFTFGGEDLDLSLRVGRRHDVVFYPGVEITHYGRVSTRQHIGFASRHMTIGFARYLRKCGCSPEGLLLYKTAVTLDAPLQVLTKLAEFAWRRLSGRRRAAEKSWLVVRGLTHFLAAGLPEFWSA